MWFKKAKNEQIKTNQAEEPRTEPTEPTTTMAVPNFCSMEYSTTTTQF